MHQEHKNTITQHKQQLKIRFGCLLQPSAWKWSGPILKGKGK